MPIQNPMRPLASRRSAGFDFGVSFGVVTLCRSSCRTSRRGLRRWAPQNRRAGRPVASAHRPLPCSRAAALLLTNDAGCLWALVNISASFYCNSPLLWPTTHCGRSWVPRWPKQEPRCGQRKQACERSANQFPIMPAARPAPDRRPIPSLRSVIPQVGGQARFALKRSTASVALGSAPSSFARWDSLLLLSRTSSVSAGALPSLCAAWGRLIAFSGPLGPARTFAQIREVLAAFAPVAGAIYALPHGAGCERAPEYSPCAVTDFSSVVQSSDQNVFQSTQSNQSFPRTKEQISHHATH